VTVGDRVLKTRFMLVCTGSSPMVPPIDGLEDVEYLTSENLFEIPRPPDSLVIIGGGPISCEIAQALTRLGVEVTMLESLDRLLQRDDIVQRRPAAAATAQRRCRHPTWLAGH
jgi:pyruvate/2-oxoglutarate dehydrogenase complex dihydrolipoamide dehydrogenase (E3) component